MDNILSLKNISYSINDNCILSGFSLNIRENTIHSILGTNGTGKTTLGYIIMGLDKYRDIDGDIYFKDKRINDWDIVKRARSGITLGWQVPAVFEGLTVEKFLKINTDSGKEIKTVLEKVGLDPDEYTMRRMDSGLSGGERKRIELASVILMKPGLVILDEPDSGIDIVSIEMISDIIEDMNNSGITVIIITHSEEMSRIADYATLICNGTNLKTGRPRDVADYFADNCRTCGHKNQPDSGEF
ncbi:MAG: ATP-binding cassette domain-containing protein [candidate division WOR-3 bacterium]|nr:ATP-binding cassette domain-containing protein [candidate division WOR-3 bacterium]